MSTGKGPLVLYGGYGVFGRLVAEDLLIHTDATLLIVGRNHRTADAYAKTLGPRARGAASDITDRESVNTVVAGASGVVCCAGPFQELPLHVLRAAIARRVPYVDIADSRAYVRRLYNLEEEIRQANIPVLTGASTVPGTALLLVALARESIEQIDAVHIALLIGNQNAKGDGAIRSLLSHLDAPIEMPNDGADAIGRVWSQRELIEFPAPIGRRPVYGLDAPDYDLLPRAFGVKTVTVKCGFDVACINRLLEGLTIIKRVARCPIEQASSALRAASRAIAFLGTGCGALRVEVLGTTGGRRKRFVGTMAAHVRGQRIAAIPAAVAAAALWRGDIRQTGILLMHEWMDPRTYLSHLERRGVQWAVQTDG